MIAHRITKGKLADVAADDIAPGAMLLVKTNEYVPADGVIEEGSTSVSEREVTGLESIEKYPGSRVYAGSLNETHDFVMRATATGADTILHKKQQALARVHATPDKKAKQFFRTLLKRGPSPQERMRILAQLGVYVASPNVFRQLQRIDTVVFDKTGIITTGARHIEHVVSYKPFTQQQVLNTAAAVEIHSNHMAAAAIVQFAKAHGAAALQKASDVKEEALGMSGVVSGRRVLVGPHTLLERKKIKIPKETLTLKEDGLTVVYIVVEKDVAGYIALSNPVKKSAKEVITTLKKSTRVVLFSGEHEETAAAIAKQTGMHEVIARVRDENRDAKLLELREKKKTVAYVTALHPKNEADITITMGTRHAFEGDVTILTGNLQLVQTLFEIVKQK